MKKLFLILLFLWAGSSWAEIVVTIGAGTGSNINSTYPAPYGNYYWGARHQFLYTASELTAAGLGSGNITTVAFNVTALNGVPAHQGYTVQMKNTSTAALNSWENGLTTVLNPAARTPVIGWNTYILDVPFYWDGMSNLLVEICFNNSSWTYNASTQWTTNLPGNYSIWYYNDLSSICSNNNINGSGTTRPNIQLTGQEISPCSGTPDPGNTLSTLYSVCPGESFTLSLESPTNGTGVTYQWQYSPDGLDPWTNVGFSVPTCDTVQATDTWYRCQVTCSGNTGISTPALIEMAPFSSCYCTPVYSTGCESYGIGVTFFSLNTISQTITCTGTPSYYHDFSSSSTDLVLNNNYLIQVETGPTYNIYFIVWIDYNQNGQFDSPGERAAHGSCGPGTPASLPIYIDGDAMPGPTRLRIMSRYYGYGYPTDPCSTSELYGNCADFTVNIVSTGVLPDVETTAATGIEPFYATINGTVNANDYSTLVWFEYGLTPSYGTIAEGEPSPVTGNIDTQVNTFLIGLEPNTTFHYRVKGGNSAGNVYGEDLTFTTSLLPPTVSTVSATSIGNTTAVLNGTVNANNLASDVYFEYGLSDSYGSTVAGSPSIVTGFYNQTINAPLTGLEINSTYHFRIVSTNDEGTSYGDDMTFTTFLTPYCIPIYSTGCEMNNIGLTYFELNTISQTIPCTGTPSYFHDYTATTTDLILNGYYPIVVTGGAYPVNFTVWIDYNQNDIFDGIAEVACQGYCPASVNTTAYFSVDGSSMIGSTGLRIMSKYESYGYPSDPCSSSEIWGNCADFSVNVVSFGTLPSASTELATDITAYTVTLNGLVNANNFTTSVWFEYGTSPEYWTVVNANPFQVDGATDVPVNYALTGLSYNTTYYYRIKAGNSAGTVYGDDQTFTTSLAPPTVYTGNATNVQGTTATIQWLVNPNESPTDVYFEYGLTDTYGSTITGTPPILTGLSNQLVTAGLTGLEKNSTYHFRIVATNDGGTTYGNDMTFTTLNTYYCIPAYSTGCSWGDGLTYLELNTITQVIPCTGSPGWFHDYTALSTDLAFNTQYTISVKAGYSDTYVIIWIDYNQNHVFDTNENAGQVNCTGVGTTFTIPLYISDSYLAGLTTMRAITNWGSYPTNPCGSYNYGNCQDFTLNIISVGVLPTVTSTAASSVGGTTATVNGTVNANDYSTNVYFDYGVTDLYETTVTAEPSSVTGTSVTPVSKALTGLLPGTLYHYRLKGFNSAGTAFSDDMTFTTEILPPTVTTGVATMVGNYYATLNGMVIANNLLTDVYFEYGLSDSYGFTIEGNPSTVSGMLDQPVTANMTGLEPGTIYHYRIVGISDAGTSYGNDITFTTLTTPYCIPVYAFGCDNGDYLLNSFTLNTISQSIPCTGSPSYFKDLTSYSTDLAINGYYSITVSAGNNPVYYKIWIDYNMNDVFDNDSETVLWSFCGAQSVATEYFTVAENASVGSTGLRVMSSNDYFIAGPCSITENYGNCADFTVNIIEALTPPEIITQPATDITAHEATMRALVNANGNNTTPEFYYWTDLNSFPVVPGVPSPVTGDLPVEVSASLTLLLPNTTYYYYVVGHGPGGYVSGNEVTFTTLAISPTAVTQNANTIGGTSAKLNATVNANNLPTTSYFEYGTNILYGESITSEPFLIEGYDNQQVNALITGLEMNTTYHFRIVSTNDQGTTYGEDMTFTTISTPYCIPYFNTGCNYYNIGLTFFGLNTISQPISCTGSPSYYHDYTYLSTDLARGGYYAITVSGWIDPLNYTVWIDYNQNNNFDQASETVGQGYSPGNINSTLYFTVDESAAIGTTRLRIMSKYYYYGFPTEPCSAYEEFGNCADFTVNIAEALTPPNVTTQAATDVTAFAAVLHGTVNANGNITTVNFLWGFDGYYGNTIAASPSPVAGNTTTDVSGSLTNLVPNYTYIYKAVGFGPGGYVTGDEMTFTTTALPPVVTTNNAVNLGEYSVRLNGTVNPNNSISEAYFEYGTDLSYGSSIDADPFSLNGFYNHSVSTLLTGLDPNTEYHFRVVSTNATGTSFGEDLTFTVWDNPYCVPHYSVGCEMYNIGLTIFQLETFSHLIECTGSPSYYHDYTSSSVDIEPDSTYTVTVTAGSYNVYYSVWIDYNQDYYFDPNSETVGQAFCAMNSTSGFDFTVGGDALPGSTRIRIMSRYQDYFYPTDPCSSYEDYGNCADFGVNIAEPVYVVWTGMVNNDWNNPGNWSTSIIPAQTDKVKIPSAPSGGQVFPIVPATGGPFSVRRIEIEPGATVNLLSGSLLNVLE